MATAKWAKPEHIKKILRQAKAGKVRFAFTSGDTDFLMMDDTLEPSKLLAKAKSESGNKKGCCGEAWIDGSTLVLQAESPVSGLKKKFVALAKENEIPVKGCKVLKADGTEEGGEDGGPSASASSTPSPDGEYGAPPPPAPMPGVSLGAAGLDPRFKLPAPDLGGVAQGINQEVKGAEKALPKELENLRFAYGMMQPFVQKASLAELVADIRSRYPNVPAGPELLAFARKLKVEVGGALDPKNVAKQMLDPSRAIEDALQAEFLSNLPSSVKFEMKNGVVTLTKNGAALNIAAGGAEVESTVDKDGKTVVTFKKGDATIQVENASLTAFDPKLRAKVESIEKDARDLAALEADKEKLKLKIEQERKLGKTTADLDVDFKKLEADLVLKRDALGAKIEAQVKATTEGVVASVKALRSDGGDKKAGADLELATKDMVAKFKLWSQNKDAKTALEVAASGKGVSVKFDQIAAKSGTVVTAEFEAALKEVRGAISLAQDKGNTKITAELKKKADDITAKLELLKKEKNFELAAKLESDLKDVRGTLQASLKSGDLTFTLGVKGDSAKGEVGGTAKIDVALTKGISFLGGQKGKFQVFTDASNKGYAVGLSFSIGSPPDVGAITKLFNEADAGVRKVYELAADPKVRSIDDVKKAAEEVSTALAPVSKAVNAMKEMDKKKFSAELQLGVTGGWPAGGTLAPPTPTFGLAIHF